jgi:hypothetical protein
LEYLIFAFGFALFIPFCIWAVVAGLQNTRHDSREQLQLEQ